tara:strand:- start:53 stop:1084 length:1032 start_codon:yes stop_codon:yes gene_type:complete
MATRATSSASGSSSDESSRCHLLELSHDELGVIVDGLADPLQPDVAVTFSSTCKGLRTPLRAALKVLQERHERARVLCRKMKTSCADGRPAAQRLGDFTLGLKVNPSRRALRGATVLDWDSNGLTADDMATLGMLLPGLKKLWALNLFGNHFGDPGMQALCESLGRGTTPLLRSLALNHNLCGTAGTEALAAALLRGAMPQLEGLYLGFNLIGNQAVALLAPALRKLPMLKRLNFRNCIIGDEGVASLVSKGLKALEELELSWNRLTDKGCATLVSALDGDALPCLAHLDVSQNDDVGEVAKGAVEAALGRAHARRYVATSEDDDEASSEDENAVDQDKDVDK